MKKKTKKKERYAAFISKLQYESLRDKALDMAWTLRKIDRELQDAAQCEGDYPGGYPSEKLLPNLCKIMYASQGYHDWDEFKYPNGKSKEKDEKCNQ